MRGQGQSGQAIKLFQITLYVNNPSFKSNNVTFLGCQNIGYSNPSYIFSEGSSTQDPQPPVSTSPVNGDFLVQRHTSSKFCMKI